MNNSISLSLDDRDLAMQYLSLASSSLLQQSYGNLLLIQQSFSMSNMDAGFSTRVAAYQRQMYSQACYYNQDTLPKIITMLTFGSNFSALVGALNGIVKKKSAAQTLSHLSSLNQQLESLSDQAESYSIIAQSTCNQLKVAWGKLTPLIKDYQLILQDAEKTLSGKAKRLVDDIRSLNADIAQNIQDIVTQGNKAGDGVRLLGKGIIASFTVDEPDKKDVQPEKQNDSGEEAKTEGEDVKAEDKDAGIDQAAESNKDTAPQNPVLMPAVTPAQQENSDRSIEYFISGITAISSGVTGASQAEKSLLTNTQKISQSYQSLAETNAIIAVAKSVYAQNVLFTDNFKKVLELSSAIPDIWHAIASAFQDSAGLIHEFKSEDDIKQFERALALDTLKWNLLSQQIESIKSVYAGNGTLPDA